jgi:UDP-N-acetylmuramoyl-tripeptide--D-alanyl-D-alanine ligase
MNPVLQKPVLWTAADAAAATRGRVRGEWIATGVSIDSRSVAPGDLFIAIQGPTHDGHAFVADAIAAGAAAAVISRPAETLDGTYDPQKLLLVSDTMTALEDLGRAARARTSARIAGVTGSVGKTSTKEALKLVLGVIAGADNVTATQGNLNNHWGLPLSLARMPIDTAFGVFEMGMNHPGEISPLSRMCRPHAAVITTVAETHSAFFKFLADIADAKAEIFDGVEPGGVAILNRDNPMYAHLASAARRQDCRIVSFGADEDADWRLLDINLHADCSEVRVGFRGTQLDFSLGVPGRHMALNILAVLAAVDALDADVAVAAEALAGMRSIAGRGERHDVRLPGGTFKLIDESYNASPTSMRAAVEVLGNAEPDAGGRRVAVLGDMLELGQQAEKLHVSMLGPLRDAGVDLVFTAGQYMAALWDALPANMRGGHACTAEKLVPIVSAAVAPGDVVMVKGSLGSRTRQIVDALLTLGDDNGNDSGAEQKRVANGG